MSGRRKMAQDLVADSILVDAAAKFVEQIIEEVHAQKIRPLVEENKFLRKALEGIGQHAANQNMGHLDFRTKCMGAVDHALSYEEGSGET